MTDMQNERSAVSRPAAASLSYTVSAAVGKAAALITLPFFTARLGAAAYGRYALFLCYEGLLFSAISMGLGGAALFRALRRYRGEEDRLLAAALGLSLAISVPILFGALVFLRGRLSPFALALLFPTVLARVAFTLFGAKCRYLYRYKPLLIMNLSQDLLSPLLSALLLLLFPMAEKARILGAALVLLPIGIISALAILRHRRRLFDPSVLRYLLSLLLPLLPHYLSVAFMAEAARLSVERVLGSEALGAYAVAHSVGLALSLITGSLGGAFQPWVLRKTAAGEYGRVSQATERLLLSLLTVTLLPILAAPEIFSLLAPKGYAVGAAAVPALAFTVPLSFLSTVPILSALGKERRAAVAIPSVLAALSQLLLCPALAERFGIGGAAAGARISYFLFFLLHAAALKKEEKRILNVNKCFLLCLSFAAVGLSLPILYPYPLLRLLLFLLYLPAALMQLSLLKPLWAERAGARPKQA